MRRKSENTRTFMPLLDCGKLRCLMGDRLTHAGTARLGIRAYRLSAGQLNQSVSRQSERSIPWLRIGNRFWRPFVPPSPRRAAFVSPASSSSRLPASSFPTCFGTFRNGRMRSRPVPVPLVAREQDVASPVEPCSRTLHCLPFQLDLAIDLKTVDSGTVLTLVARVVHVTKQDEGNWIIGCRFLSRPREEHVRALL